jgi:ABC-type enterochelin transport system substrate-binding protein
MALAALLLGAIAVSACGDEADGRKAKNTYVRELNAAQQEFATNASKVSQQGKSDSLGQYRRTVRRFEATIAKFATKLRGIEVPSVVRKEHEQLIAALTSFGNDFQKVTGVLNNPNARTLTEAQNELMAATQRANARIEAAAAAIDSKLQDT